MYTIYTCMCHLYANSYRDNYNEGHEDPLDQQLSFGTKAQKLSTDINTVSIDNAFGFMCMVV